jgi:hypothetical protein
MNASIINEGFFPAPSAGAAALGRRVFLIASRQPYAATERRDYSEELRLNPGPASPEGSSLFP